MNKRTKLSVNVNKIALLRNSRGGSIPNLIEASQVILENGADGLTVHPRPDARHITADDVFQLAKLTKEYGAEFNIEGNPLAASNKNYPGYTALIEEAKPDQASLVPDTAQQLTSDHGWDIAANKEALEKSIRRLALSCKRISLFMDAQSQEWPLAKQIRANNVELYTEAYACAFAASNKKSTLSLYASAAKQAIAAGLDINAGHGLNLENLADFLQAIPGIAEVSIGHALISEALHSGLKKTVQAYKEICLQWHLKRDANTAPV